MTTAEQDANFEALMSQKNERAVTAFLVYQNEEGQWVATADYNGKVFDLDRQATFDDIVGGCAAVQAGCAVQQTAMAVIMMMEQRAQAMQAHIQSQQEAAKVSQLIDPTKLRNPRA